MKKDILYRFLVFAAILSLYTELYCDDFFKIREGIINNAWRRAAFFYLRPALTLENVGYTSNIYSYSEFEEPDWTADIGIDLQVSSIIGNRFILSVKENPYYSYYAENVDQRALSNKLTTTVYTYLGRINLKYSYRNDFIKGSPTAEFGALIRTQNQENLISLDYGKYENFFVNLFFKQSNIKFYEENYLGSYNLKEHMNREELRGGISFNKRIFTQTQLFLKFEYFGYTFEYESFRDGIGREVSFGVIFPEIGRIQGSFEVGAKFFSPATSSFRNYTKPFGSGDVTIKLFRKFRFEFQYLINNFYSFWNVEQSFNERSGSARIEYYISKNIKIGYNYHLGILSYELLTHGEKVRQDNFYTSALYFGLRIFKKMGVGVEYRKYRADSDVQSFSRSNDFIGGYLIHEF
jgi:hypothetical protein